LADETIAALRYSHDELRRGSFVAKRLTHVQDMPPDHFRQHVGIRPESFQKLFGRHQLPGTLHQKAKDVESLRGKSNATVPVPKTVIRRIEPE
jgi:hypothetical protein